MTFSPDGRALATAGYDRTVRLWDLPGGRAAGATDVPGGRAVPLATLRGHTGAVNTVAFRPDGRIAASAGTDGRVVLWDVRDPARPARLATLTGHRGGVKSVAFSPDGRTVASASADHTVRLWNVTQPGRPAAIAVLTGHRDRIDTLAFGPDGRLATGSVDHTAMLWDVDPERVAARLCAMSHPALTRTEWDRHLPGLAFHPPC